jgi:hypothetical protein
MASAPDTANRGTDRETLAALALLLATSRRRYDLPALIAQAKIRPRRMGRIAPTNALASNMAAPHFLIVKAWEVALPDILAAVPLGRAAVAAAIDRAAAHIPVYHAKAMVPRAVESVEHFHRGAWVSRIKAATGLDVAMFTQPSDVADPVQATTVWQQSLADDVHSQIKGKLIAGLLVAGLLQNDGKALAGDVIAKAKRRAAGIGQDQTVKLSRAMDRDRAAAASITKFLWWHSGAAHPRLWHQARNAREFAEGDIAADDRAGVPPFCECYEIPVLG